MLFRMLLLFVLILVALRAVWWLLRGVAQGASGGQSERTNRSASPPAVKMVRDPVCGTYVVPGRALELARGRETLYFCSEKCRDQYFQKR